MTCPYCGTPAKPNSAYCAACGQLLAAEPAPTAPAAAALPPTAGGVPGAPTAVPVLPPLPPIAPRAPAPLPAPLGAPATAPSPSATPTGPTPVAPASAPAPAPAPPPAAPAPAARPAELRLPDGSTAPLAGQLVLGRNPGGLEGHTVLALEDPLKMLSRSHLAIDARGARVTAMDLGSANGTTLERSGAPTRLGARLPVILEPGDALVIGSLRIEVG